jgi:glycosyltransferase involved in cell wall biosynthesis
MRIVQLTPGTGNFHCGNCLRDTALVAVLRRMGYDVLMVPLYLPHVTDSADLSDTPVFFGGVNVYLQQKSALFRHTPRWLDRMLDGPGLLKWAADHSGMTSGRQLGEITVSMLRGEEGRQGKELSRLIAFLKSDGRPDIVCLSNGLLVGLAHRIRSETGAKVLCTLAGEDSFLDWLVQPYRDQAWEMMRQRAADVDAYIPVSHYYAQVMAQRLALDPTRVRVVHNGVDPAAFRVGTPPAVPTIGYMAYMSQDKGLGLLVEAFIRLRQTGRVPEAKLCIAGAVTPANQPYVQEQRRRLESAGLRGAFEFLPNISAEQKREFLASLSVLSVPATYGEAFGLYVLEAWASGVPVVQPRHAAFPELIEPAGGGILCRPDDPDDLAAALERLVTEPQSARQMGQRGRQAVIDYYNIDRMAEEVIDLFNQIRNPQPVGR